MLPWRSLGTLPNLLSSSRFVLALAFVALDSTPVRLALIAAAAATDFLDGWAARRMDAASPWGALLDPLADRAFALAALATLLFEGLLGSRAYFVLIFRDLATAVGFLVARIIPWLRPVVFEARITGKAVTVLQLLTLAIVLVAPRLLTPLLLLVFLVSVVSIVDYTVALWRARAR